MRNKILEERNFLDSVRYDTITEGFGIISHIISHERGKKEALGNLGITFAILAVGLLGFVV